MKIFLDSSDVEEIRAANETGLIDGVTTNPSLILKSGGDPVEVISDIAEMFPWDSSISAEVVGETYEDMIDMADDYIQINPNITIKVPCTVEGLKACKELAADDIKVNVTLIFSTAQAILAAKAGATYVSPFVGRCNDNSVSGVELVRAISNTYQSHGVKTNILAASLRDVHHVSRCFLYGADVVTMPPKVFWKMYDHVLTREGLAIFDKDWAQVQEMMSELRKG
jgi:transaldolase|tara:strand:- start:8855 stop:9529 length:675 start_codon:yes stop_codon:yes gene_type:complete